MPRRRGSGAAGSVAPVASPRCSWRARTEPSTTASTTSRCDGLNASTAWTLPPRRAQVRREALVVLDVARALRAASGSSLPSNSENSIDGDLPSTLTSTLRRPRWAMPITISSTPRAPLRCTTSSSSGISASPPSSEKRFWPDVARVQVALEPLGGRQLPEQVQALVVREAVMQPAVLEAVLQPQPLVARRDVRELGADAAGVDVPELLQDLRQLHLLVDAARAARGVEHRVHVGLGQADIGGIEHARHRALHQAERIDVRDQVAAVGVELDQARDGRLLLAVAMARVRRAVAGAAPVGAASRRGVLRARRRRRTGRRNRRHSGLTLDGVRQEALVLLFDVRRLRARERARFVEFAQGTAHGLGNYTGPSPSRSQRISRACPHLSHAMATIFPGQESNPE